MNKYYCTKCNTECVIATIVTELTAPCSKCNESVKWRRLDGRVVVVPPVVEATPEPVVVKPAVKPNVTKLDVSYGAVKASVSK